MKRLALALLLAPACVAWLIAGRPPAPLRVLFIGNSLTYVNDLPSMVETAAGGHARVECESIAYPDFGLEEHWRHGEALRAIRRGGWTHVVLQQGPSSLPESRRVLVQYARRFAPEIRRTGASVVLYGVWPGADRLAVLDAVTASYVEAAKEVGGTVVAVGDGWKAAWAIEPSLPLYGLDRFHPSPLGTYLGALMFAEQITGVRPGLPTAPMHGASPAQLRIVHTAAAYGLRPRAR
ncbi:MAG: hypothetical protein M3Q55_17770 [Acidobacteriota bacterium]|nr:hypothetical protein [Acidobacteriota bacterium]